MSQRKKAHRKAKRQKGRRIVEQYYQTAQYQTLVWIMVRYRSDWKKKEGKPWPGNEPNSHSK